MLRTTLETVRALVVGLVLDEAEDPGHLAEGAVLLLRPDGPVPPVLAQQAVLELLGEVVCGVAQRGWRPSDLVHAVLRRRGEAHVPGLLAELAQEAEGHRPVSAAWVEDLVGAGEARPLALERVGDLQRALELIATLSALPPIAELLPPPGREGAATAHPPGDAKLLARVRALLAKAESTQFAEEAEALSSKAQELISRHALDELLKSAEPEQDETAVRRIWLDAPYLGAKASLVHQVALANRSRSVSAEPLGFTTVVGRPSDIAAVELLVTSLLVQASIAMRRCGQQIDRSGRSRTRSFRQSFLLSYARRIGERLHEADVAATAATGRAGELVPVLRRHADQVDAAVDELFPETFSRPATISHRGGWAAGRAAADQARLGVSEAVAAAGG